MFYSSALVRINAVIIALVAAGLGACASTPDYVPADGADDYGHYSTRLGEDRYRIVFNGSRKTGPNTTRDYALLRAAELTLQEGYDWFQVMDRESRSVYDRAWNDEPRTSFHYERAYYVEQQCGLLGCTRSARPTHQAGMHVGDWHDERRTEARHSHALEIVMGKGKLPAAKGDYYDASTVAQSLWASM